MLQVVLTVHGAWHFHNIKTG